MPDLAHSDSAMDEVKPLWRMNNDELASVRQELEHALEHEILPPYRRRKIEQQLKDLDIEQEIRERQALTAWWTDGSGEGSAA